MNRRRQRSRAAATAERPWGGIAGGRPPPPAGRQATGGRDSGSGLGACRARIRPSDMENSSTGFPTGTPRAGRHRRGAGPQAHGRKPGSGSGGRSPPRRWATQGKVCGFLPPRPWPLSWKLGNEGCGGRNPQLPVVARARSPGLARRDKVSPRPPRAAPLAGSPDRRAGPRPWGNPRPGVRPDGPGARTRMGPGPAVAQRAAGRGRSRGRSGPSDGTHGEITHHVRPGAGAVGWNPRWDRAPRASGRWGRRMEPPVRSRTTCVRALGPSDGTHGSITHHVRTGAGGREREPRLHVGRGGRAGQKGRVGG